jgi:hypothetical protein
MVGSHLERLQTFSYLKIGRLQWWFPYSRFHQGLYFAIANPALSGTAIQPL